MKPNLTEKMSSKITAIKPDSKDSFTVKNAREMQACYRAAEVLGLKIGRQVDYAHGGWRVIRFT
jgi:sporulation-control protein spo0M